MWTAHAVYFAAVVFAVALARRRHGRSTGALYGLMPLVWLQFAVNLALVAAAVDAAAGRAASPGYWFAVVDYLSRAGLWIRNATWCGQLYAVVGVLGGLLLANVLANHLVRRGRWSGGADRDTVVRPGHVAVAGNIMGLARRPSGGAREVVLHAVSLATRHPLGAAAWIGLTQVSLVLLVGELVGRRPTTLAARAGAADVVPVAAHFVLTFALAGGAALLVALWRRRSGLPTSPLGWLPVLAAYQFTAQAFLVAALGSRLSASFAVLIWMLGGADRLTRSGAALLYPLTAALALAAAALGWLIGAVVAGRKLRSGRWETIVPVESPKPGS
jgi:hypothetical protein